MAAGDRMQVRPIEGEVVLDRLIVPLKPLEFVKLTVTFPDVAARIVKLAGLVFKEKSGSPLTARATVVVWLKTLLVAVTVML